MKKAIRAISKKRNNWIDIPNIKYINVIFHIIFISGIIYIRYIN